MQVVINPKPDKLMEALDKRLFTPDINPGGKLLIFTESKDTTTEGQKIDHLVYQLYNLTEQEISVVEAEK